MTSRVQMKITYNHPIMVTKDDREIWRSSEDHKPGTYIGEHSVEIDEWFSGTQEIKIKEIPSKE